MPAGSVLQIAAMSRLETVVEGSADLVDPCVPYNTSKLQAWAIEYSFAGLANSRGLPDLCTDTPGLHSCMITSCSTTYTVCMPQTCTATDLTTAGLYLYLRVPDLLFYAAERLPRYITCGDHAVELGPAGAATLAIWAAMVLLGLAGAAGVYCRTSRVRGPVWYARRCWQRTSVLCCVGGRMLWKKLGKCAGGGAGDAAAAEKPWTHHGWGAAAQPAGSLNMPEDDSLSTPLLETPAQRTPSGLSPASQSPAYRRMPSSAGPVGSPHASQSQLLHMSMDGPELAGSPVPGRSGGAAATPAAPAPPTSLPPRGVWRALDMCALRLCRQAGRIWGPPRWPWWSRDRLASVDALRVAGVLHAIMATVALYMRLVGIDNFTDPDVQMDTHSACSDAAVQAADSPPSAITPGWKLLIAAAPLAPNTLLLAAGWCSVHVAWHTLARAKIALDVADAQATRKPATTTFVRNGLRWCTPCSRCSRCIQRIQCGPCSRGPDPGEHGPLDPGRAAPWRASPSMSPHNASPRGSIATLGDTSESESDVAAPSILSMTNALQAKAELSGARLSFGRVMSTIAAQTIWRLSRSWIAWCVVVLHVIAILPRGGSGPFWWRMISQVVRPCAEQGWWALSPISPLLPGIHGHSGGILSSSSDEVATTDASVLLDPPGTTYGPLPGLSDVAVESSWAEQCSPASTAWLHEIVFTLTLTPLLLLLFQFSKSITAGLTAALALLALLLRILVTVNPGRIGAVIWRQRALSLWSVLPDDFVDRVWVQPQMYAFPWLIGALGAMLWFTQGKMQGTPTGLVEATIHAAHGPRAPNSSAKLIATTDGSYLGVRSATLPRRASPVLRRMATWLGMAMGCGLCIAAVLLRQAVWWQEPGFTNESIRTFVVLTSDPLWTIGLAAIMGSMLWGDSGPFARIAAAAPVRVLSALAVPILCAQHLLMPMLALSRNRLYHLAPSEFMEASTLLLAMSLVLGAAIHTVVLVPLRNSVAPCLPWLLTWGVPGGSRARRAAIDLLSFAVQGDPSGGSGWRAGPLSARSGHRHGSQGSPMHRGRGFRIASSGPAGMSSLKLPASGVPSGSPAPISLLSSGRHISIPSSIPGTPGGVAAHSLGVRSRLAATFADGAEMVDSPASFAAAASSLPQVFTPSPMAPGSSGMPSRRHRWG